MSSEKEFRDILRDKLNEKEFRFDPEAWEQARHMLDANKPEKGRRPFLWIFVGCILLSGISLAIWKAQQSQGNARSEKSMQSPPVNTNRDREPRLADNDTRVNERPLKPVNENPASAHAAQPAASESTAAAAVCVKDVRPAENKVVSGSHQKPSVSAPWKVEISIRSMQGTNGSGKQADVIPSSPVEKEEDQKVSSKSNNQPVMQKSAGGTNADSAVKYLGSPASPAVSVVTADSLKESNEVPLPKQDSLAAAPVKTDTSVSPAPVMTRRSIRHIFTAEGGFIYFTGWKNPGNKDAGGYNPVLGFNYTFLYSNKIHFGSGANYYTVSNLSYSSKTSSITSYGFGEEKQVTVITPKRLHYLGVPLRFTWFCNAANQAGLAYHFGYLMNVSVEKQSSDQKFNKASNSVISKERGFVDGFQRQDHLLSVFYRRRIYGELFLNLDLMYGLSDVKENQFFDKEEFERNTGIRCTLSYELYRK